MGNFKGKHAFAVSVIASALLMGCGGKGVMPTENLTRAETAIRSAQTAEGRKYAPLDLKMAEDKLAEAKVAAGAEEYEKARRLADEALVHARLSEKTADTERAKRAAKEMGETIEALRRAIQEPGK